MENISSEKEMMQTYRHTYQSLGSQTDQ